MTTRLRSAALVLPALLILLAAGWLAVCTFLSDYWTGIAAGRLTPTAASADLSGARASLVRAIRARPDIADSWRLLATIESNTDPKSALTDIQTALKVDPLSVESWYNLALIEFQLDHGRAAMADLRQAVNLDPGGEEVHFRLANLARALGQDQIFWDQLRVTASVMDPNMVGQVLAAAAAAGKSPGQIASILPLHRPLIQAIGVSWLADQSDWEPALSSFLQLGPCPPGLAATWCQSSAVRLVGGLAHSAASASDLARSEHALGMAQQAWNHGTEIGILPGPRVSAGQFQNGDFRTPWLGTLFSWRDTKVVPYALEIGAAPQGGNAVRFDLPGRDEQQGPLLEQELWIQPGRSYIITLSCRDAGTAASEGISAAVLTPAGKLLASEPLPLSSQWQSVSLSFTAPILSPLVQFQLQYRRPPGQLLFRGPLEVAQISMRQAGS